MKGITFDREKFQNIFDVLKFKPGSTVNSFAVDVSTAIKNAGYTGDWLDKILLGLKAEDADPIVQFNNIIKKLKQLRLLFHPDHYGLTGGGDVLAGEIFKRFSELIETYQKQLEDGSFSSESDGSTSAENPYVNLTDISKIIAESREGDLRSIKYSRDESKKFGYYPETQIEKHASAEGIAFLKQQNLGTEFSEAQLKLLSCMLSEHGKASMRDFGYYGDTPENLLTLLLHWAIHIGNVEVIEKLLLRKDVEKFLHGWFCQPSENPRDSIGRRYNAIILATRLHQPEILGLLLRAGAKPADTDLMDNNALHHTHDSSCLELLLEHNPELINAQGWRGNTALHNALGYGGHGEIRVDDEFIESLLFQGASIDIKNKEGKTPLEVACGERGRAIHAFSLISKIKRPDAIEAGSAVSAVSTSEETKLSLSIVSAGVLQAVQAGGLNIEPSLTEEQASDYFRLAVASGNKKVAIFLAYLHPSILHKRSADFLTPGQQCLLSHDREGGSKLSLPLVRGADKSRSDPQGDEAILFLKILFGDNVGKQLEYDSYRIVTLKEKIHYPYLLQLLDNLTKKLNGDYVESLDKKISLKPLAEDLGGTVKIDRERLERYIEVSKQAHAMLKFITDVQVGPFLEGLLYKLGILHPFIEAAEESSQSSLVLSRIDPTRQIPRVTVKEITMRVHAEIEFLGKNKEIKRNTKFIEALRVLLIGPNAELFREWCSHYRAVLPEVSDEATLKNFLVEATKKFPQMSLSEKDRVIADEFDCLRKGAGKLELGILTRSIGLASSVRLLALCGPMFEIPVSDIDILAQFNKDMGENASFGSYWKDKLPVAFLDEIARHALGRNTRVGFFMDSDTGEGTREYLRKRRITVLLTDTVGQVVEKIRRDFRLDESVPSRALVLGNKRR